MAHSVPIAAVMAMGVISLVRYLTELLKAERAENDGAKTEWPAEAEPEVVAVVIYDPITETFVVF